MKSILFFLLLTFSAFASLHQILPACDEKNETFTHGDIVYKIATDYNVPFVSISSHPLAREIISFDPANCPLLHDAYLRFVSTLKEKETPAILEKLTYFIKNEMFDPAQCTQRPLGHFLIAWKGDFTHTAQDKLLPVIPLDAFISARTGVCRHFALVVGYFLEQLIKDKHLQGKARLLRSNLPKGSHAWNLFTSSENETWHVDAYWGVVENVRTGKTVLVALYGDSIYEDTHL